MYLISKLLMNFMQGKFGLDTWLGQCVFYTKDSFNRLAESGALNSTENEEVEFNNQMLVKIPSQEKYGLQAYLPIAIVVTAYARADVSIIKNNPNIILLYSDTDSGFVMGSLPAEIVSDITLGKW